MRAGSFSPMVSVASQAHIGKPTPAAPAVSPTPHDIGLDELRALVWQTLKTCYDPEIPVDIVELGLVYVCDVLPMGDDRFRVSIKMTLTAPGCGMGEILVDDVRSKLEMIPTVAEADVELVFDPPWGRHMMSEAAKLETGML
jgi:probable FeS assembly SUF system protein SufT